MTREEALEKIAMPRWYGEAGRRGWLLDALEQLGLLKFDTTEEKDRTAAIDRLAHLHVMVTAVTGDEGIEVAAKLTYDGAAEILDILTKSGFKISR